MAETAVPAARGGRPRPAAWRRLLDRLLAWRDARIADPGFQAWAARTPVVRRIAARRARALFDVTAGFVYAQTLGACVELDLFRRLLPGPRTPAELAPALGLEPAAAQRLLAAAAALGLLEERGAGRYGLGQLGAAVIGAPGVAEMIRHHAMLYRDLADPVGLLRAPGRPTETAAFWGYAGGRRTGALSEDEAQPYRRLMAASQAMVAAEVLAAWDMRRHRHLMDVGGGLGAFALAAAGAAPALRLTVFDLPAVARLCESRLAGTPEGARIGVASGDFFADPLPEGADAISLIRVVHDHDDAPVRRLLARVRSALQPGGWLILAEPMAGAPGAARVGDAYFGWYMAAMGAGRTRSRDELRNLLAEAGFSAVRSVPTTRPFVTGLLVARRP